VTVLAAGEPAPDFSLARGDGSRFTNADLAGNTTVLVFYPFAFSPVCTDQLNLYEEVMDELADRGATLYGVSCDATWSQTAFREQLGVSIEQLSDFEPKGETCRAFGVYHPGGFPQRALVIVGPDGVVKWS
jgi:peroxiredoxin (alkyl hydroperoxide reductase subunit C)